MIPNSKVNIYLFSPSER